MQEFITVIQTVGFPIACALACGYYIFKMTNRDKDEAHEREQKQEEQEDKLADALTTAAQAIEESTKVNTALSETNKLMATDIKASLDKILDKVSSKGGE